MPASYPGSIRSFTPRTNFTDIVLDADVNSLQDEVHAIEATLGVNPALATSPSPGTGFNAGASYGTVGERLNNIENGLVGDVHTQYVKKSGDTITGTLTVTGNVNAGQVVGQRIAIPFHVSSTVTTGLKEAKFLAPCNMTLRYAFARQDSGSGSTYQIYVNGASVTATSPSTTTSTITNDFNDVNINQGDAVQINVIAAGGTGLSVTIDGITR